MLLGFDETHDETYKKTETIQDTLWHNPIQVFFSNIFTLKFMLYNALWTTHKICDIMFTVCIPKDKGHSKNTPAIYNMEKTEYIQTTDYWM